MFKPFLSMLQLLLFTSTAQNSEKKASLSYPSEMPNDQHKTTSEFYQNAKKSGKCLPFCSRLAAEFYSIKENGTAYFGVEICAAEV